VLGGYELGKALFHVGRALGATVFDNAVLTPIGVVTNLAQALATGTWSLVEDPVKGTLDVMAAGGIAVGTIVTSTGALTYEFLKGALFGVGNGIVSVFDAGLWVFGAAMFGAETVYSMFDFPQHHDWAAFRREEIKDVFEAIKKSAEPTGISWRLGELLLIRVHWFGEDKGKVRFFITKDKKTGERWFFRRTIDPATCEVQYSVTNRDPLVRYFAKEPWVGTYHAGLYSKRCKTAAAAATASATVPATTTAQ
jgi:hypothetical protein